MIKLVIQEDGHWAIHVNNLRYAGKPFRNDRTPIEIQDILEERYKLSLDIIEDNRN